MEEIKKEKNVKREETKKDAVKKLSYEELENAAKQISAQLDAVIKENARLKSMVTQLQIGNLYTELGFRFKVIEQQESFNPLFVEDCISEIERIMTINKDDDTDKSSEDKTD